MDTSHEPVMQCCCKQGLQKVLKVGFPFATFNRLKAGDQGSFYTKLKQKSTYKEVFLR